MLNTAALKDWAALLNLQERGFFIWSNKKVDIGVAYCKAVIRLFSSAVLDLWQHMVTTAPQARVQPDVPHRVHL